MSLDSLGMIERGRSRHRPRNDPALYGGTYPFFQTGDVAAAELRMSRFSQTYNESGLAQSRLWPAGTVCITIAATVADSSILAIPGCFPDSVVGFTADPKASDPTFVKYLLDTAKARLRAISRGTTQDNLSLEKLLSIKFRVPPVAEQRKIASVLAAYDELIENNLRRIEILEEMAQAMYREWFVNCRYPGWEDYSVVDADSGLLPHGWSRKPLGEVSEFNLAKPKVAAYDGERTYLATADCEGFHRLGEGARLTFSDLPSRAQHFPLKHSVWFGRMAGYQKVMLFLSGSPATAEYVLSSGFACLSCVDDAWASYVVSWVLSDGFEDVKASYATGATQVSLTDQGAQRLPVVVPSRTVVSAFGESVLPTYRLALVLHSQNANLRATRDLLLPKLVSGEIDVSDLDVDTEWLVA